MAVLDEATVGERVAFYRRRRGVTQEVLAGLLRRHDDEALAALVAARVAAPEQLMFTRRVHDMVAQMLRRDRRGRRELRELADFIGVG